MPYGGSRHTATIATGNGWNVGLVLSSIRTEVTTLGGLVHKIGRAIVTHQTEKAVLSLRDGLTPMTTGRLVTTRRLCRAVTALALFLVVAAVTALRGGIVLLPYVVPKAVTTY